MVREKAWSAWKMAGYLAAAAFLAVSAAANFSFALSLGSSPYEKAVFATASLAADLMKAVLLLVAIKLWKGRHRFMALAAALLFAGCLTWSMASAIGFTAMSRSTVTAETQAAIEARRGWKAKIERLEASLKALPPGRPASVIESELAASQAAVSSEIWRRTKGCREVTLPESVAGCDGFIKTRHQLATELTTAKEFNRLESELSATRGGLGDGSVAGSVTGWWRIGGALVTGLEADAQAAALRRITGLNESTIRDFLGLMLAFLIEAGSALGFTLMSLASNKAAPKQQEDLEPTEVHFTLTEAGKFCNAPGAGKEPQDWHTGETIVATAAERAEDNNIATTSAEADNAKIVLRSGKAGKGKITARCGDAEQNRIEKRSSDSKALPLPETINDPVQAWALLRLDILASGAIPATEAYQDFSGWCVEAKIKPCSPTAFGRRFTTIHAAMGGQKIKRRDGTYYSGVSLQKTETIAGTHGMTLFAPTAKPERMCP